MNLKATLSPREEQMTVGLVLGKAKKEIADELNISIRTVENTIYNAQRKIEVKKSTELVVYWFIKHFSIPVDAIPKSIVAAFFMILICIYEFYSGAELVRNNRFKEVKKKEFRQKRDDENSPIYLIEL